MAKREYQNDLLYTKEYRDITNKKLVCTVKRFEKNGFLFLTAYGIKTFGNTFRRMNRDNDLDIDTIDVIDNKLSSKGFLYYENIEDEAL